jgi:hypothetical protein
MRHAHTGGQTGWDNSIDFLLEDFVVVGSLHVLGERVVINQFIFYSILKLPKTLTLQ